MRPTLALHSVHRPRSRSSRVPDRRHRRGPAVGSRGRPRPRPCRPRTLPAEDRPGARRRGRTRACAHRRARVVRGEPHPHRLHRRDEHGRPRRRCLRVRHEPGRDPRTDEGRRLGQHVPGRLALQVQEFPATEDARAYPSQLKFGLKGGFQLPSGVNPGQRILWLLNRIALPYGVLDSFDALPTPYPLRRDRPQQGRSRSSSTAATCRSPCARRWPSPLVFTPVQIGDRLLVDGGTLNNIPADVVRQMGADIVIAVDVAADVDGNETAKLTLFGVMGKTIDAMMMPGIRNCAEVGRRGHRSRTSRASPAWTSARATSWPSAAWPRRRPRTDEAAPVPRRGVGLAGPPGRARAEARQRVAGDHVRQGATAWTRTSAKLIYARRGGRAWPGRRHQRPRAVAELPDGQRPLRHDRLPPRVRGRQAGPRPRRHAEVVRAAVPLPRLRPAEHRLELVLGRLPRAHGLHRRGQRRVGAARRRHGGHATSTSAPSSSSRWAGRASSSRSAAAGSSSRRGPTSRGRASTATSTTNSWPSTPSRRPAAASTSGSRPVGGTNCASGTTSRTFAGGCESVTPSCRRPRARTGSRRCATRSMASRRRSCPRAARTSTRRSVKFFDAAQSRPRSPVARPFAARTTFWQGEVRLLALLPRQRTPTGCSTTWPAAPPSGRIARGINVFSLGGPFRLGSFNQDELRGPNYLLASTGYLHELFRLPDFLGGSVLAGAWAEAGSAFDEARPGAVQVQRHGRHHRRDPARAAVSAG